MSGWRPFHNQTDCARGDSLPIVRVVIRNLLAILLPVMLCAQEPARPIGTVSSARPLSLSGTTMSPTGAPSWPVMAHDELVTQGTTLFTTADNDTVIFNANTKARLDSLPITGGAPPQTYILLREGGLTFDAKASRLYLCAGGRLFVPEVQAAGVIRIEANGTLTQGVSRGVFAEQGQRSCTEAGPGSFLTGQPNAAGGTVAPNPGLSTTSKTQITLGVGAAVAILISSFLNANPGTVSSSQP